MKHVPVMINEVLRFLLHEKSRTIVDGTVGCGGHAAAILKAQDSVRIIGLDRDGDALSEAEQVLAQFTDRVQLMKTNYSEIESALSDTGPVDGILLDLGVSSLQIDTATRGFSYSQSGPLDMRMSQDGASAAELLEHISEDELTRLLRAHGEVDRPRRVARAIAAAVSTGDMRSTDDLKAAVEKAVGAGRATPAFLSRVFQSLRIEVNRELEHIDRFIADVRPVLKPAARIVVLSYHSLEDRRFKTFFARQSRDCLCPPRTPICVCGHQAWLDVLTRRVVKPTAEEIDSNPRSRSARLRAAAVLN